MIIKVDVRKLRSLMKEQGITSYKQLAIESGVSPHTFWISKNRDKFSKETLWLISERLDCSINDFVFPDWEDEA